MSNSKYWVWLQSCIGFGSPKIDDIVTNFNDIKYFYENLDECLAKIPNLNKNDIVKFKSSSIAYAEDIITKTEKLGFSVIGYDNPLYPNRLRNIYAPPAVLYVNGNLKGIDEDVLVAMVGARTATPYGHDAAAKISTELALAGITVVSGLAEGIDTASHIAAVKAKGKTIAVLGCGLDVYYPSSNRKLQDFIGKTGAVITEYPLGTKPNKPNFPMRNRIISGISLGVLVVEASNKSGSLITAHLAIEQGRDVFAVPGSIFNDTSKGTFRLLYDGAIPVSCGNDIINEYKRQYNIKKVADVSVAHKEEHSPQKNNEQVAAKHRNTQSSDKKSAIKQTTQTPDWLEGTVKTVFEMLTNEPILADDLLNLSNLPSSDVLCALTELEILNLITSHPGNKFSRK